MYTNFHITHNAPLFVWDENHISYLARQDPHFLCAPAMTRKQILSKAVKWYMQHFCIRRTAWWSSSWVFEHRTAINGRRIKYLADVMYPDVENNFVMDNLNIGYKTSIIAQTLPCLDEARRIMKRLRFTTIPKHGSWLDIAEIELNVMTRHV